jgi:hypothetical protein
MRVWERTVISKNGFETTLRLIHHEVVALGPAPWPGVCDPGPGLSALRRPAADPGGGDGAARGATAPCGARARRRAAARAASLGRLTRGAAHHGTPLSPSVRCLFAGSREPPGPVGGGLVEATPPGGWPRPGRAGCSAACGPSPRSACGHRGRRRHPRGGGRSARTRAGRSGWRRRAARDPAARSRWWVGRRQQRGDLRPVQERDGLALGARAGPPAGTGARAPVRSGRRIERTRYVRPRRPRAEGTHHGAAAPLQTPRATLERAWRPCHSRGPPPVVRPGISGRYHDRRRRPLSRGPRLSS